MNDRTFISTTLDVDMPYDMVLDIATLVLEDLHKDIQRIDSPWGHNQLVNLNATLKLIASTRNKRPPSSQRS